MVINNFSVFPRSKPLYTLSIKIYKIIIYYILFISHVSRYNAMEWPVSDHTTSQQIIKGAHADTGNWDFVVITLHNTHNVIY